MKKYNKMTLHSYSGSFTVEAAYIVPLVFLVFCIAIDIAISLQMEVKEQALVRMAEDRDALVDYMYRKEYIEELLGELYEN